MIDKELIRQAAEDIDIFDDNFALEYEELLSARRRQRSRRAFSTVACIVGVCLLCLIPYMPSEHLEQTKLDSAFLVRQATPDLVAKTECSVERDISFSESPSERKRQMPNVGSGMPPVCQGREVAEHQMQHGSLSVSENMDSIFDAEEELQREIEAFTLQNEEILHAMEAEAAIDVKKEIQLRGIRMRSEYAIIDE